VEVNGGAARSVPRLAVLLAAAFAFGPFSLARAQQPGTRQVTIVRGTEGIDTLRAHVHFVAGRLSIGAADTALLYRADVRYDASRARPIARFDGTTGTLEIGAVAGPISRGFGLHRVRDRGREELVTELSLLLGRDTPTELIIDANASEGEIALAGVPLHLLRIGASASDARIGFVTANPAALPRLDLSARAAAMHVSGLGNANASRIIATVTAGQLELRFDGDWTGELALEASATLGRIRLQLPDDVGIRITARERLFGTVQGAERYSDGSYRSANWESATRRIEVLASATMGTISIERLRR
jgi:hypothetical protein